jgi:hypothetical protein
MSICAASVQVGPHAMLRIVLSAIVTGELMLCELRSSHRTFRFRAATSTSSAKYHLRAPPYRASGFVPWPVAAQSGCRGIFAPDES